MKDYISTTEAAELLGCTDRRVRAALKAGLLAGERIGRDWVVNRKSVQSYRDSPKRTAGRPPTTKGK